MAVEFWTSGVGIPTVNVRMAVRAEDDGWDGITYVDSQNLSGDCYIAMALAAHATSKLKLGTGVTNPFTRHPAATASAIATVQAESQGRAYLGIGRGDSALAHLGLAPAPVKDFEDYLIRLQGYLRGEDVPFPEGGNVDSLRLANQPTASRIAWLRPHQPKVPVDVAATGPRVIRSSAVYADRVSFAVGADPARVRWGIETARDARRKAGLAPDMPWGAYVPCVVHDDPATARHLGEGGLSLFARFSVMHGTVVGPASATEREVLTDIHRSYDMTRHSQAGSPQAGKLTDDFATEFGIFGSPSHCIARFRELMTLGIDRFMVVGPSAGADRREADRAAARFREEVMPALRR
jgi:5,10-methylenetetrahydromethanopterin reductase